MGVHHAWGRTLKDAVIRFHAMQGQSCRYQNGFDCQGLWVEVEVERALGLQGQARHRGVRSRQLLAGVPRTGRRVRAGDRRAVDAPRAVDGLGQLLLHLLGRQHRGDLVFLQKCFERKYLYEGHVPLPWCTRCGTSLSQHEMLGSYTETESLVAVRERRPARRLRPRRSSCGRPLRGRCPRTSPRRSTRRCDYEEVAWEGRRARLSAAEPASDSACPTTSCTAS